VTRRVLAVLAPLAAEPLLMAMLEDVVDLLEDMREVDAALAVPVGAPAEVADVTWPSMSVVQVPAGATAVDVLDALAGAGLAAEEVGVVAADVPDLPVLLLGKLHSAMTAAEVAVCPAEGGGLVAVAARLPVADWLRSAAVRLDDADALERLRAAAPPRSLFVGPGWHRIRSDADTALLDPGLEGWENTRALLGT
jgi:2-phospho-L-lactate guanylyltransferase (CobY/MobA/RfbA family)